ncbi:hypothetical protein ACFL5R_01785 [Pseudomonadota bacterium]
MTKRWLDQTLSPFGVTQSGVKADELQGNTFFFIEMIGFPGMFGFVGIAEIEKRKPLKRGA